MERRAVERTGKGSSEVRGGGEGCGGRMVQRLRR